MFSEADLTCASCIVFNHDYLEKINDLANLQENSFHFSNITKSGQLSRLFSLWGDRKPINESLSG